MTQIIDGKAISAQIRMELKEKTAALLATDGIKPGLAMLLVGDNPASQSYVGSKKKACEEIGYLSIVKTLPATASESEVLAIVNQWNNAPEVHGILVQMPLPKQISEQKVIESIKPSKDVDGFHPVNVGKLMIGLPCFVACTPLGIMELLRRSNIETKGKHVVVVGRSNIVGKPIANLLYQKNSNANAVVTICHTGAKDLSIYTRQADILIAAMGSPKAIKSDDVKDGAVVIDVGVNRVEDSTAAKGYYLCGDVDYENVKEKCSAITPVPGGVGPMTIASLLTNTYNSAVKLYYND
jgi:methylenetetrahydrofolate dehydrogenase (NADP+)/methenyltetrahydrofolate cyclohydrolase